MANQKKSKRTSPDSGPEITLPVVLYEHGGKICVTIFLCLCVAKADPKDVPEMFKEFLHSEIFEWLGWIVAIVITLAAIGVVVFIRRTYIPEIERISAERDKYQAILLGRSVQHSKEGNE